MTICCRGASALTSSLSVKKMPHVLFSLSVILYSCTTILPYLPSSRANWRQTCPGTVHLWAFTCATYSRVSLLNWSLTHTQLKYCWSYVSAHLIQLQHEHHCRRPPPFNNDTPKLPSTYRRGASSSWVLGASFCLSGSKATALYVRNMIRMSETRKWTCVRDMEMRAGRGEPGSVWFS